MKQHLLICVSTLHCCLIKLVGLFCACTLHMWIYWMVHSPHFFIFSYFSNVLSSVSLSLPCRLPHHCYHCLHWDDHLPLHPSPHELRLSAGIEISSGTVSVNNCYLFLHNFPLTTFPILPSSFSLPFSVQSSFSKTPVKLIQHPTAPHPAPVTITKSTLTLAQTDPKAS